MRILLLGGSKFMGLLMLEKLIKLRDNLELDLYVLNRGNKYWDGLFYKLIENKNNFVHHFKVDRSEREEFALCIKQIQNSISLNSYDTLFDFIIDFTAYKVKDISELFKKLEFRIKNYIFISTDSTYNASEIALKRDSTFFENNKVFELMREEDASLDLLQLEKSVRKQLKKRDKYGYNKLKCEIYLRKILENKEGKSFICLRLPDVLGEFDESYRLWYYIIWLKYSDISPVEFEKIDLIRKSSFVLRDDVVDVIMNILFSNEDKIIYKSYNIACEESITLKELVDYIFCRIKNDNNKDYSYVIKESNALTYYPSVTFGAISIEKAKTLLNFKPVALSKALDISIEFFNSIDINKYSYEYEEMIKDLPKKIKEKIIKNNL